MKYLWTSFTPKKLEQPILENIASGKTRHIKGYGFGVTFSTTKFSWDQSIAADPAAIKYSEPVVVTQR